MKRTLPVSVAWTLSMVALIPASRAACKSDSGLTVLYGYGLISYDAPGPISTPIDPAWSGTADDCCQECCNRPNCTLSVLQYTGGIICYLFLYNVETVSDPSGLTLSLLGESYDTFVPMTGCGTSEGCQLNKVVPSQTAGSTGVLRSVSSVSAPAELLDGSWPGTQTDCCQECCDRGCVVADYIETAVGYRTCNLYFFEASSMPVPANATQAQSFYVLSGCSSDSTISPLSFSPPRSPSASTGLPQSAGVEPSPNPSPKPVGPIVGGVIAGLVGLCLVMAGAFWLRKRHSQTAAHGAKASHAQYPGSVKTPLQAGSANKEAPLPEPSTHHPRTVSSSILVNDAKAHNTLTADNGEQRMGDGFDTLLQSAVLASKAPSTHNLSAHALSMSNSGRVLPSASYGTLRTTPMASTGTLASLDAVHALIQQLDAMHKQGTLLRGRYRLLGAADQRMGAQGVVRFANLATNPAKHFAIKFFLNRRDFDAEQALYSECEIIQLLAPTDDVSSNESEAPVLGRRLPPVIVTERGESLDEWTRRCRPDFFMCVSIVGHLAQRVEKLHAAGLVHRDLKPANVMWLPSANGFTVIDFGSTARAGADAPISCTLAYAAPEVVAAHAAGEARMTVTGALDVWSLGVIFYEFLTGARVLACGREQIVLTAGGAVPFPWEARDSERFDADMRSLGILRPLVLDMLARDPVARITMADLAAGLRAVMQRETTIRP